jgi:hypothetical protein
MAYDPTKPIEVAVDAIEANSKPPAEPAADQERIANARKNLIALSKSNNQDIGFPHHADYWTDFAGPETSKFDFSHIAFLLNLLEEPKFGNLYLCLDEGHFDFHLANWTRVRATDWKFSHGETPNSATLAELKVALASRIKELGISEILLAEWMAIPLGIADDQAFDRLPFSEKMQTFRGETL